VTIPDIVKRLNADDNSSLIVVQAADPDALRIFACSLGMAIYQERRRSGQITPLVSFIFDEADEFIPLNVEKDSSYANSTAIAMTLARRGRKFGLGIGIATQRVTYLNTSIMAQPHTYFISKLPRRSDRERVCEAFGISEDMFRQTFKFRKGNWLLVSHDATGLESVPLPVRTPSAGHRGCQSESCRRSTA
jgi:DNA helicase HerA-like ATPase